MLATMLQNFQSMEEKQLPWWQQTPRAAVYNRYLRTAGGGERSSLEYARVLEDLGFTITLITDPGAEISLKQLVLTFGIYPRNEWKIVEVACEDVGDYCRRESISVFVNHTFSNYLPSPATCGIYSLMFPHHISPESLEAIKSYKAILCNSPFSELHGKLRWSESLPLHVIPPPVSDEHFLAANNSVQKEKLILLVGRFNVEGHSKCQKEALEAFTKLKREGVLDADWKLVVVGHVNEGASHQAYYQECCDIASEGASVIANVSFQELVTWYQKAAVLWQFTGIGRDFGLVPERCEHLGLVALDALCYGTIPVIYCRSGAAMLMNWGQTCYTFRTLEDLARVMHYVAMDFGNSNHAAQMKRCRQESKKYSYKQFRNQVKSVLLG